MTMEKRSAFSLICYGYVSMIISVMFVWTCHKVRSLFTCQVQKLKSTIILSLQKECVNQGQTLVASQLWDSAVNYVLMAWSYVEGMPDWDNPSHNKSKEQCFKGLAAQCKKALMKLKSSLSEEKCADLLKRWDKDSIFIHFFSQYLKVSI